MSTTDVPFPECILNVLRDKLAGIPGVPVIGGVPAVHLRNLDPTDPDGSIGIKYELWKPVEVEMGGRGFNPTLGDYVIQVEHLTKHSDRATGELSHRTAARAIRSMLYRDPETQLAFRQLTHIESGAHERLQRWSLEQHFADNKIGPAFYFVSGTTVTFQTETV